MEEKGIPESFFCPISGEVFVDPVIATDGQTYERKNIEDWLKNHNTSPFTSQPISTDSLQSNLVVRNLLDEWRQQEAQRSASPADMLQQYRIPFEDLTLGLGDLGQGSFKSVERGSWHGREVAVAVMRDGLVQMDRDLLQLGRLGRHPHILTFHGVATSPDGKQHLVTEVASHGSLLDVLADLDDREAQIEPQVLLAMAQQVCEAMQYIACHEVVHRDPQVLLAMAQQVCEAMQYIACHEVVHRDLAARNVLVFEDLNPADPSSVRVKVSDFGLSRPSCYYQRTATGAGGDALPVRYMPPEAIQRNKWSEKSDVWAFGVLLWEVAALGAKPYESLGVFVNSDAELKAGVCRGTLRLPRPEGLP
eukprot:CAMPEP_0118957862 /NCGR_PEP_ID=MMETSP1169-20130426/62326_1 /TAXON_ID=36882 /ORGANISM="Pyramimonas obovata, Strain CCMP722" /LENGTH=362 /DNA_ID=CAMNT_0006905965 /DNA_START=247 /DNA_END=1331 /DNA_ORIENTATION=-